MSDLKTPNTDSNEIGKISRDKWVKNGTTLYCQRCNIEFGISRRRHHCRMCGYVVCNKCSQSRVKLSNHKKKSRVCQICFDQIAPPHMRSQTSISSYNNNMISITSFPSSSNIPTNYNNNNKNHDIKDPLLNDSLKNIHESYTNTDNNVSSNTNNNKCCSCIIL